MTAKPRRLFLNDESIRPSIEKLLFALSRDVKSAAVGDFHRFHCGRPRSFSARRKLLVVIGVLDGSIRKAQFPNFVAAQVEYLEHDRLLKAKAQVACAGLLAVGHDLSCEPEVLLSLDEGARMAQALVLNNGRVADALVLAEDSE